MIHKDKGGRAKCGTYRSKWNFDFQITSDDSKVDCSKCLNKRSYKIEVLPVDDSYIGKVFTYSFGYDMTINVYAKVIERNGKVLIAKECWANVKDDYGKGAGRSTAGGVKPDGQTYRITLRRKTNRWGVREYFTGMGRYGCSLDDGKPSYYNTWD